MTIPQNKSALLVSSAILLRQAGYDQKAIDILQDAIREDALFAPAYVLLGTLFQATGREAQAEDYFRKAMTVEPDNAEALQGLGLFLVSQKRYSEALPYLEKHLKKNPADSLSLDGLIDSLHHLSGREKQIRDVLRNAWESSKNPDFGIRYGRYLLDHNEQQMARKIFSDVVEVSKTPRALAELALTCLVIEDCDCAIQLLLEAVEIDHLFDRGWRGLAQCYNNANDFEKALEAAERAIAINPNHYRNWQAKSDVLLSLRQFDKVLGTSQKGIELIQSLAEKEEAKPVWSVLHLQRFHAFLELQRVADALTEASLARMEIPDDSRFFSLPVQILLSTNHSEQALDILDSASDPIVKDELAPLRYKTLHQLGRGEEAWNFIRPHLEKNTEKRLNILANIGVEFYQRGLRVPAIAVYRQLVNFKPADARFANNLGYFLIENGQLSEAEGLLTAVLENPEAGLYAEIARCNMAYLFNLIGKYPQALDASTAVLNSEFVQETAILRVPFWANGKIQPDPAPIPGRELVLADAAWACAATSALANGQISQAQNFVDKLLLESPDQILAGMMAGCLEAAKGNLSGAADLWNQLINVSEQSPEAAVLKTWLAQLT